MAWIAEENALVVAIVDDPHVAETQQHAAESALAALRDRIEDLETMLEIAKRDKGRAELRRDDVSRAARRAKHVRDFLDDMMDSYDDQPHFPDAIFSFTFGGPPPIAPAKLVGDAGHISIRDILHRRGNFALAQRQLRAVPDLLFCPQGSYAKDTSCIGYLKMMLLVQSLDINKGTAVECLMQAVEKTIDSVSNYRLTPEHKVVMHCVRKWVADMNPRLAWQTAVARVALARPGPRPRP